MSRYVRKGPPKVFVYPTEQINTTGIVTGRTEVDVSANVVSFNVHKDISSPAGTFEMSLLPSQVKGSAIANIKALDRFYLSLRPNTLVSIGFQEPGGIMLGLIDRVTRTRTMGGPRGAQGIVLAGRDLGKAFINDNLIRATTEVSSFPTFVKQVAAALGDSPVLAEFITPWATKAEVDLVIVPKTTTDPVTGVATTVVDWQASTEPAFQGGSIKDVVDFILQRIPTMRIPMFNDPIVGYTTLGDIIAANALYTVTPLDGDQVYKDLTKDFQGTIWGFLASCLDEDIYEIRVDTIPDNSAPTHATVALIIRPKPFDEPGLNFAPTTVDVKSSWLDLETLLPPPGAQWTGVSHTQSDQEFAEDEVLSESLGFDDSQAVAYYMVTSQHDLLGNSQGPVLGLSLPLIDLFSAKRFGLKAYEARLVNAGADVTMQKSDPDGFATLVRSRVQEVRNRLFNWYRLNAFFEAGTMTVVGRDRVRVGDPIRRPKQPAPYGTEVGMRYYATGVTWEWTYGGQYTTTIEVSRGHTSDMLKTLHDLIQLDGSSYFNPANYASADPTESG